MSVDIKANYGAAGDTQLVTATVTLSLSTPTQFSISSNLFVSGDALKTIALEGAVTPIGPNPFGVLLTTISAVGAFSGGHQTVTMADSATVAITGTSQRIEWGTNDAAAFVNFTNDFQGQSGIILTIPAGRYAFAIPGSGSTEIGKGIKDLTVNGTGGPTLTDMIGAGSGFACGKNGLVLFNDNTKQSLIQTVNAGATVLHMVTAGDAARYSPNTWAWMTGYDQQGTGNPPNPSFADFVFITAADAVGGTVTISSPLTNSYKSTWPAWVLGSPTAFGLGGPATLYVLQQDWDASQVWNGVNFSSISSVFNCSIRSIAFNNSTFPFFGPNVSVNQIFTANNITVGVNWELDKGTQNFNLSNSTVRGLNFQNSSPFNTALDTVTVTNIFNGTPTNCVLSNSIVQVGMAPGPNSTGGSGVQFSASNNSFVGLLTASGVQEKDIAGAGAWSCSNGLMSRSKFSGGTGEPPQWAIPGSYFVLGSRHSEENRVWKCVDIYDNGTTLFLQTDQSGGFPAPISPATALNASAVFPLFSSFSGNSGCDDAIGLTGGRAFSRWSAVYSGNIGASDPSHLIKVWGQLVSIKITVFAGYSAGTLNLSGPFVVYKPQNTEAIWSPVIDLTQAGVRTILGNGTVTGNLGTDSITPPNGGSVWLVSDQIIPAMSGALGSGSVQIEIQTDQGFPLAVAPLRLRLHA